MIAILIITTAAYVLIPSFLLFRVYKSSSRSYIDFYLINLCAFSYLLEIFLIGSWAFFPLPYLKYLLFLSFFYLSFRAFKKIDKRWFIKPIKFKNSINYSLTTLFLFLFLFQTFQAFIGFIPPKKKIDLAFPLEGKNFSILHGGAHEIINHHQIVSAQKYALDIVRTDRLGRRAKAWVPSKLEDFWIYQTRVISPCDGTIVQSVDGLDDQPLMKMDTENICGNYLVIYSDEKQINIVLAHLKKGSVAVRIGDKVKKNQPLAYVGNSGNTSEPHLHIHATRANHPDYLFEGEGVPITFSKKFLIRNQTISNTNL